MICTSCSNDFEAANQHSECPKCGQRVGTDNDRDDYDALEKITQAVVDWDDGTYDARKLMERDCDYFDNHQLTDAQELKLKSRNQPPSVFNRAAKKIDYLRGAEIRNRTDPKALPRKPTAYEGEATAITDAIRYVCDTDRVPGTFSKDYKNFLVPGICGHVVEKEVVKNKDGEDSAIRINAFHWDRLWWDVTSRELDYSDKLHGGTVSWMDYADVLSYYRRRKDAVKNIEQVLDSAKNTIGRHGNNSNETHADRPRWYDPKRNRLQVWVAFYKDDGVWMTCHFVSGAFLVKPRPTGYRDEQGNDICPLIMASPFRDDEGCPYGLMRRMISAQDEINNRRSRLVHRANTRQIIIEKGVVDEADMAKFRRETQKPDGVAVVNVGALANGKLKLERDEGATQTDMALLQDAYAHIEGIGPNTPTAQDAATSGRDRQLQQQLGSLEIEPLNDVFRELKRTTYRYIYLCVRESWTYEKWMRVSDDAAESGYRFVGLNRPSTKGQRVEEMIGEGVPAQQALASIGLPPDLVQRIMQVTQGSPDVLRALPGMDEAYVVNDVARLDVDIVIDEAPDTSTVQHEVMQDLRELGQSVMSSGGQFPIDLYVENSDLRPSVKAKWLERLRPKNPDPQQMQMQQMMQQMQQTMIQLDAQLKQAQVGKTNAEAELAHARAADLGQPDAPQMPEAPDPVKHAQAQREAVGTQLDIARAQTHIARDKAQTQKIHVDTMAVAQKMMEPKPTQATR